MTINSDVTIFNLRIGADRREKFYATRILGVSWYESKGQVVSDTVRKGTAQCVIRIPYTAIVEGGKQYISEEEYKKLSDEDVEKYWTITSKVSKGDMGSFITQYYNNVIIAFNKNSKYVQINPGEIAIYNNGVSNSKKRAVFDQNGSHYWRDGYYVGKIGTNMLNSDNSKKGLNFDLEWPGAYMAWAAQDYSGASSYTMKWTYVQKNKGWSDYTAGRLHAGCDIDMHNWTLRNVSWPDGSINGTLRFVQIISMNSDGTAGQWSSNCLMQFKNGILIKGTWYG